MIFSNTIVTGFKILLDMAFITLQDKREIILDELNKPKASVILLLNKQKPIF